MILKSLTSFQKFQSGSKLWVLFFEPQRRLFKEINWRTGFLLGKIKSQKLLEKPVLLDTQKIFPNQSTLCLPLKKESWVSDIYKSWKQLDKPSFRIFLPLSFSEEELDKNWSRSDYIDNIWYYKEKSK